MNTSDKIYSTAKLREEMENPKATVPEIRDYLESKGIDRHSRLEMPSFDVLVISLDGAIYGYQRIAEQKDGDKSLSMFGGTVQTEEVTREAIAEVLMAKTPLEGIVPEQIVLYENPDWSSAFDYENGDKTFFHRTGAICTINSEQEEDLLHGPKERFHSQIKWVEKLNGRSSELWDYQQKMYQEILKQAGISE